MTPAPTPLADGVRSETAVRLVARRVAGIGFTALLAQVLLVREANVWLRGNEFIIACVVACWLLWAAAGNAAGYALAARRSVGWIGWCWLASVVVSVAELVALRCCWTWTGSLPGEAIDLGRAALMALALTAPPCLLAGCALGAAVRRCAQARDRTVAWLYLRETLGAVIAGALATFVLIPLNHWWVALAVLCAAPVVLRSLRLTRVLATCALVAAAWWATPSLDRMARAAAGRFMTGSIALDLDTPRARMTVTTHGGEAAFYTDGRLCGANVQREDAEETSWYAALSRPAASNALAIGFAYNGLVRELNRKGIAVTVLDVQRAYLDRLEPFLLPEDRAALASPMTRVVAADCRSFLRSTATPFDLIIQDAGIPESYSSARMYSKEWFSLCARCLGHDGVLTVILPGSAGYVPDDLARLLARTRATLASVFTNVTMIPASRVLLLATNGEAVPDSEAHWRDLWRIHETNTLWFNAALIGDHLNPFRIEQFTGACSRVGRVAVHRDLMPAMYGDALVVSEARFAGPLHGWLGGLYAAPARLMTVCGFAAVAWACALLAFRRSLRLRVWLAMAAVAAAGFIAEMTAVIRFVIERGSVFFALGALFACFMLGLAVATRTWQRSDARLPRIAAPLALAVVLLAVVWVPWPASESAIMLTACMATFASAFCVGAWFACAARSAATVAGGGVALYLADLLGALLGGVLFSVVVPPVLGFGALAVLLCIVLLAVAATG